MTHVGACGACSSLQDLSVYMDVTDMVSRGKLCAIAASVFSLEYGARCYRLLGYTEPCAAIWSMDSAYTSRVGQSVCLRNILTPNNVGPTCELNACIACDEVQSGTTSQRFAGRTRRRSGLLPLIKRNCSDVATVVHRTCRVAGADRAASPTDE